MEVNEISHASFIRVICRTVALSLLTGLFLTNPVFAVDNDATKPGAANGKPEQVSPEEKKLRQDWNKSMLRKPAPKKGCFTAAYPSTDWKEVPCTKAPNIPALPRHGLRPAVVGNGDDIVAEAPTGTITQAIGHFENVTNVTSESGPIANAGPSIANTYTLQINTDFFTGSTACAGAADPTVCLGWEQWVFWNTGTLDGTASMQYWLINYNTNCPGGVGWNQINLFGGISCWKNSNDSASVPNQPITNMANWTFTGIATATGDSVVMSTGTNVYMANGDNVVAAASAWTQAEFNIFGYGGDNAGNGGTASFNAGAQTDVRTQIIYGGTSKPNCVVAGFTAEMNNLSFGPTIPAETAPGPAVIFTESTAGTSTANCALAVTVGDTHLHTFEGLFYDFQATGDFTLAKVAPNFEVQTRQKSGAPTWPNASVNKAVAVRFGKTRVAVCLAKDSADPRVIVDGKVTPVTDGQLIELPGLTGLMRRGNVYQIYGNDGNSIRATINSYSNTDWIDVSVGLGRWPSTVKGLIANVNGNVNQIASRDNQVLTAPFAFDALYHTFGDSWRVKGKENMLAACDKEIPIEIGVPKKVFYATHLKQDVREKALAVCNAAGVAPGPLLDACTLDVAVIGKAEAAKVFVNARKPVAVGIIVDKSGGFLGLPLWLWLLLLIIIILIVWWMMRRSNPAP